MARRQKVEVLCDRCKREYEVPETSDHTDGTKARSVFIDASELGLGQIALDDLCPACDKRVSHLIRLISKVKADAPAATDGDTQSVPSAAAEEVDQQSTDRPDNRDGLNHEAEERQMDHEMRFATPDNGNDDDQERKDEDERGEEDEHDEDDKENDEE